ncbi:hypothetical protein QRN89_29590 [Streptomyces chengbuensis]|uniref:hypothetical protein n=1 Tax=Streptomyces chengbuensis TaxID=3053466 RepID=UPI0025B44FCD|nr:hypothetical protein [Streptomyces sp. HUAS CB01]WJY53596.1 hypothetical protein QRN89_29590 [Streptomyces sp. HUAS CB01]
MSLVASGRGEDAADAEALQLLLEALQEDLLALDIDRVEQAEAGPAPEGSRAGVAEAVGALLVVLAPSLPLLEGLVGVVQSWLERTGGRSATLEIDGRRLELTGVSRADQRRLTDAWLGAVMVDRSIVTSGEQSVENRSRQNPSMPGA